MLAIDNDRGGVNAMRMVKDTAVLAVGAVWCYVPLGQDGNVVVPL